MKRSTRSEILEPILQGTLAYLERVNARIRRELVLSGTTALGIFDTLGISNRVELVL